MRSPTTLARVLLYSLFLANVLADSVVYQSTAYSAGSLGAAPFQTFYSTSVAPPEINQLVNYTTAASTNYTLLSYRVTGGQNAPLIMDNAGSLVWSGSQYGASMGLTVQEYNGEPVLTFFQGNFYAAGYGIGNWLLMAQNYSIIGYVDTLNQTANTTDFHEMVITPNNTALVESWRLVQTDLTAVSGSTTGWTFDCVFQEVDIATGTLMFEWRSLEHVPVEETYFSIANNAGNSSTNPFDYCHINALEKTNDGNYLVSMRGPSTIYYISAATGEILYRLGGKYTNFTMETGAEFYYQHDARLHGDITATTYNISIFDNGNGGGADAEATARGIILEIDTSAMTATLLREYIPSFNHTAASQGSVSVLDDGNVFIGWGATPYYSEYTESGTLIQDAQFGATNTTAESYRAFKQAWTGTPLTLPSFSLNSSSGSTVAHASWNGATEVTAWALIGGNSTTGLVTISNTTRTGFETALTISGSYAYLAAAALSSNNTCLGVSNVYSVATLASSGTAGTCPSGTATSTSTSTSSTTAKSNASSFQTSLIRTASAVLLTAVTFSLL